VIKVHKTDEEWKACLSLDAYEATRLGEDDEKDNGLFVDHDASGVYVCICCEAPLFDSSKKFQANLGWPSFLNHLGNVTHKPMEDPEDNQRHEALCGRCDAHLGYVSKDGPPPTGIKFLINSSALNFIFAEAEVNVNDTRRRSEIMSPAPEEGVNQELRQSRASSRRGSLAGLDDARGRRASLRRRSSAAPTLTISTDLKMQEPGLASPNTINQLMGLQSPGAARARAQQLESQKSTERGPGADDLALLQGLQSPGAARRRSITLETQAAAAAQANGIVYEGVV
jgi:peptide-methionine (R)-S-oxide reductase